VRAWAVTVIVDKVATYILIAVMAISIPIFLVALTALIDIILIATITVATTVKGARVRV
jgi:hypothetical protein